MCPEDTHARKRFKLSFTDPKILFEKIGFFKCSKENKNVKRFSFDTYPLDSIFHKSNIFKSTMNQELW